MQPLEELELLLRPAAGGLYLVSTGRDEQERVQKKLYGVSDDGSVVASFRDNLRKIASARVIVLGVPSDIGAGFRRGANLGPQAIRAALLESVPDYPEQAARAGIVDIGDVFCVPQLLDDAMLSEAQKDATRASLYPNVAPDVRKTLPVSPLSIEERALDLVFQLNPDAMPFVLGGDHSTAWPAVHALSKVSKKRWGVVQPDAHTDLLEHRLGIRICFATWSYHLNELFGRDGRLVQVGTRASRFPREHWESTLGVRQFWAEECLRDPNGVIDAIVAHLRDKNVEGVYFSNDIDGTDCRFAPATGTPEPDGVDPDFLVALIRKLGQTVGILGGDIMEVAPVLGGSPDAKAKTMALSVRYVCETLSAMTGRTIGVSAEPQI